MTPAWLNILNEIIEEAREEEKPDRAAGQHSERHIETEALNAEIPHHTL